MATDSNKKNISGLERRVRKALEECGLVGGRQLLVAVSGGPDSLSMLHALHRLHDGLDLHLHGAHLDHGLRGDASRADARFVEETFSGLGITSTIEAADVASLRRQRGLSLEEAAREVRYAFLARVAHDIGADAVAVGHTADDQVETVLMHIVRGTGLTGLKGMQVLAMRVFEGREIALFRPLLGVSRRETEEYCVAKGLQPRIDESNMSLDLQRNRVRLELLPLLEQFNPAIREAIARLTQSTARDLAYLESRVDEVWDATVHRTGDRVTIDKDAFAHQDPAVQGYTLRRVVLALKGDLEDLEQNHVEDMARLMAGPAGRSLDLPGGIRFSVGYSDATLTPSDTDLSALPILEGECELNVPGETLLPGWHVTVRVVEPGESRGTDTSRLGDYRAWLDHRSVGGRLTVRPREPGDRFQPLGMVQAKKLQDFMVDAHIPRESRDRVPLVVSPRGIAWVVGWRIAEWAKVVDAEPPVLELCFEPIDAEGANRCR